VAALALCSNVYSVARGIGVLSGSAQLVTSRLTAHVLDDDEANSGPALTRRGFFFPVRAVRPLPRGQALWLGREGQGFGRVDQAAARANAALPPLYGASSLGAFGGRIWFPEGGPAGTGACVRVTVPAGFNRAVLAALDSITTAAYDSTANLDAPKHSEWQESPVTG
jgi:hypothetical protein